MRRWNGWGDNTVQYPLAANAASFLEKKIGKGVPPKDAQLADVLAGMPHSRLADNPLISKEPEQRLRHARGQSLPDWIALRSGTISTFPDGVAFPESQSDIADLIQFAIQTGARLIPYGGGTSVVGHINPLSSDEPVVTVDMRHMNRMTAFHEKSLLATFNAGVSGPDLEAQLRALGCTLGHYPQSFEYSTLGGWIATHSKGQQALFYGRIEDLFAGGTLLSPAGTLNIPAHPSSAAGPDLRHLVLGSEGRLGFITQAVVRASPLPAKEEFHGLFFPDFSAGQAAVREMVQAGLPLSMLRLSTVEETETTLVLAGHERAIGLVEQYLSVRGISKDKSMLLAGFSGTERLVTTTRKEVQALAKKHGGVHVGKQFGKQWRKSRFRSPYLRNTLWEKGYAVDTLETAVPWHLLDKTLSSIEDAINKAIDPFDERMHLFSHISHLYKSGASVYVTYIFRLLEDSQETLLRWEKMKAAASEAIVAQGATISHQHGIGLDHQPYMTAEKGSLGIDLITDSIRRLDPRGIMNPGKLINTAR
ncbi:MAG: FAD-binding oxidoreductase [Candidatus Promineifilaceae bacterium]|jgi:alkyldihydroxyacetonephosphate synthase